MLSELLYKARTIITANTSLPDIFKIIIILKLKQKKTHQKSTVPKQNKPTKPKQQPSHTHNKKTQTKQVTTN